MPYAVAHKAFSLFRHPELDSGSPVNRGIAGQARNDGAVFITHNS